MSLRKFFGITNDPSWVISNNNIGIPLIFQMSGKMIVPPVLIFGSLWTTQYLLTSSDYYDEYDGGVTEFTQNTK